MSLLACYGGSFDPVHLGHLAVAGAVRDALGAEVLLIPAGDPPHKARTGATAAQRLRMLQLAVEDRPGLRVDAMELERDGPSWTIDTVAMLRERHGPRRPIAWVVGGDSLLQLDTWRRWRDLFGYVHLLAVARPGAPLGADDIASRAPAVAGELAARRGDPAALSCTPAGGFAVLEQDALRPESSTEARRRIAAAGDWEPMLPPAVAAFIRASRLYGYGTTTAPPL